jgi:hypothetical protein
MRVRVGLSDSSRDRADRQEGTIVNDCKESEGRISNWTLATGTTPGARHVYPENRPSGDGRSTRDDKS